MDVQTIDVFFVAEPFIFPPFLFNVGSKRGKMNRATSSARKNRSNRWYSYVFLLYRALFTIIRVRHAGSAAYHATSLIGTVIALVAYSNQGARPHVGIADDAFAVAFFAQSTDG